jgi:hypothetical protein
MALDFNILIWCKILFDLAPYVWDTRFNVVGQTYVLATEVLISNHSYINLLMDMYDVLQYRPML